MASTLNGNSLNVGGPVTCTTVDTGQGATEVHLMNQNLRTTDSPTFVSVNTGQGHNELYAMDQAVRTTDSVTFKNFSATGDEGIRSAGSRQWGAFGGGSTQSETYTKLGNTLRFKKGGTFTFYFGLASMDSLSYAYARLYKNDVAFGTERVSHSTNTEYYSQNLSVSAGDVLSIRAKQEREETAVITAVRVSQAEEGNEV